MTDSRWIPGLIDKASPVNEACRVVVIGRQGLLVNGQGDLMHPLSFVQRSGIDAQPEHSLGHLNGAPVYLLQTGAEVAGEGVDWMGLRAALSERADDTALTGMLVYASQIATWSSHNRFCGACGSPMLPVPGERARRCSRCELRQYPRLSPSMITLVTRGDEVLLARSPRFVSGVYSTLAGFVEPGETVEDCVHREIMEEVGLRVTNLRYLGSQSWPFPHSLMLGFHADYASGDIRLQPEEIEDARWFRLDDLPPLPSRISIARFLIEHYRAQRAGLPLPVLGGA